MDEVDVRIFCEIAYPPSEAPGLVDRRPSPSGIARRLRLDEKTVRNRVRRMEREGFIKYYQAVPSPALFGLAVESEFRLEAVNLATKENVVKAIHESPLVLDAHDYLGTSVAVRFAGNSEAETLARADELCQRFEMTCQKLEHRALQPAPMIPDRLDWRIMQRLRFDARSTTRALARSIGITPRMTEYRIAKLLNSRTMWILAVRDAQRQQGLVFYELDLSFPEALRFPLVERLKTLRGDRLWAMRSPGEGRLIASLFGFTLAEPESSALNALGLDGVRRCQVLIEKEAIEPRRPSWIDRAIEERISSAGELSAD